MYTTSLLCHFERNLKLLFARMQEFCNDPWHQRITVSRIPQENLILRSKVQSCLVNLLQRRDVQGHEFQKGRIQLRGKENGQVNKQRNKECKTKLTASLFNQQIRNVTYTWTRNYYLYEAISYRKYSRENKLNKQMEAIPPSSIFLAMTRVKLSSSLLNPIKPKIDLPWHCSFSLTEACRKLWTYETTLSLFASLYSIISMGLFQLLN